MDANLENYKLLVEVFKGYLDTALSVHTTYYALTGAIAAYYLANRKDQSYVKYSLLLPLIFGCALIYVSFTGRSQALTLQGKVNEVVAQLAMPGAPPVDILRQGLLIVGILDVIICVGLLLLFLSPRFIFGEKSALDAQRVLPGIGSFLQSNRESRHQMHGPKAHHHTLGKLEEGLDKLIVISVVLLVIFLVAIFRFWTPTAQQLFFDPSGVPWDTIWEGIKTLGAGAAVLRGAFWMRRKLSGEDRYFRAIYDTLDSSPNPLRKSVVKKFVEGEINDKNSSRFTKRFNHMWHEMRKQGYTKKVGVSESMIIDNEKVAEPLYSLNENQGKSDDKI